RLIAMSKLAKASTKICVGASEPKSTSVPAQSKMTAWSECGGSGVCMERALMVWMLRSEGMECLGRSDEVASACAGQCLRDAIAPGGFGDAVARRIGA